MIVDIYEYFKKHPKFNKCLGTNYLLVEYKCPLNVEEFQLWTESHLITYVISGQKDWHAGDETYSLHAGDTIFVKKGVYTTKQYFEEDYCVMLFFMNDEFIQSFIQENEVALNNLSTKKVNQPVFQISTNDSFQVLVESIFEYLKMGSQIPDKLVDLKFKELLFNIAINPKNKGFIDLLKTLGDQSKRDMEIAMLKNFQYDLPMDAFAKLCNRSLSTFKRDFKTQFNTTPSKWIITKRLELAKYLVVNSNKNINEICYESGFKNNSHFIKSFKSRYHKTPNQLRTSTE